MIRRQVWVPDERLRFVIEWDDAYPEAPIACIEAFQDGFRLSPPSIYYENALKEHGVSARRAAVVDARTGDVLNVIVAHPLLDKPPAGTVLIALPDEAMIDHTWRLPVKLLDGSVARKPTDFEPRGGNGR